MEPLYNLYKVTTQQCHSEMHALRNLQYQKQMLKNREKLVWTGLNKYPDEWQ